VTDAGNVVKLQKSLYGLKQSPRHGTNDFINFFVNLTLYQAKQIVVYIKEILKANEYYLLFM